MKPWNSLMLPKAAKCRNSHKCMVSCYSVFLAWVQSTYRFIFSTSYTPQPRSSLLNLKYSLRWISSPSSFSQIFMFIFTPALILFPLCLTLAPLSRPPSPSLYSDTKISYKISFFSPTFTTASRMLSDSSPFHWKGWLLGILILVIRGTWNKKYEYSPLFQDPGCQSPVSLSTSSLIGGGIGVVVRGNEG